MCVLLLMLLLPMTLADKVQCEDSRECEIIYYFSDYCTTYLCDDVCLIPDCPQILERDVNCRHVDCTPQKSDKSSKSYVWLIVVSCLIVLAVALVATLLAIRRRRQAASQTEEGAGLLRDAADNRGGGDEEGNLAQVDLAD